MSDMSFITPRKKAPNKKPFDKEQAAAARDAAALDGSVDQMLVHEFKRRATQVVDSAEYDQANKKIDKRLGELLKSSTQVELKKLREFLATQSPSKSKSGRYRKVNQKVRTFRRHRCSDQIVSHRCVYRIDRNHCLNVFSFRFHFPSPCFFKLTNLTRQNSDRKAENSTTYAKKLAKDGKPPSKKNLFDAIASPGRGVTLFHEGRPIGTRFVDRLEYYRTLEIKPISSNSLHISFFGKDIVDNLSTIPDLETAKEKFGQDFQPSDCAQGGILHFMTYTNDSPERLSRLDDTIRDQVIHIIGRGFRRDDDDEDPNFSVDDAHMAHELLYPTGDDRKKLGVAVVVIYYFYKDPNDPDDILMDIAGAILLSDDVAVSKYNSFNGTTPQRIIESSRDWVKIYCMVQFTILPKYGRRRLACFAMQVLPKIMRSKLLQADGVFWAGCAKGFYDAIGCELAPSGIECPFQIFGSPEEDRDHFYFMKIPRKTVVPTANADIPKSDCRFDILQAFLDKNPDNRLLFEFKHTALQAYHGVINNHRMSGKISPTNMLIDINTEWPIDYEIQVNELNYEWLHIQLPSCPRQYKDIEFTVFDNKVFMHSECKDQNNNHYEFEVLIECAAEKVEKAALFKKKRPNENVWSVYFATTPIMKVNSNIPVKNSGGWTRIESPPQMGQF